MKKLIEQLQQEERQLRSLLNENLNKQRELIESDFIEKKGINKGDVVEWGKVKHKGVVLRVYTFGMTPVGFVVALYKSNGELGKREMVLYSSETVKVISKSQSHEKNI
jgi:hypothetical protein